MDPILVPAVPLIPEWMNRLLEDCEAEAAINAQRPIKLLEKGPRKFIWNLCVTLDVKNHGVAGLACRLSEQYLATRVRESSHIPEGSTERQQFKRELTNRLPLIIALIIKLCSKMANVGVSLKPRIIKSALMLKGAIYTIEDILSSEFQVLKTLQFRIPLWTSIETAELLATEVSMPAKFLPGVQLIVNLAEFYRFKMEADIRDAVGIPDSFLQIRMRTLHLIAGAVAASARYLKFQGLDPSLKLSAITRAPHCYITCIADLMLQYLDEDEDITIVNNRKRRFVSSNSDHV